MKKPELNKIWETAIRIPKEGYRYPHIVTLRKKVQPTISILKNELPHS